jgi:hypothetical protein
MGEVEGLGKPEVGAADHNLLQFKLHMIGSLSLSSAAKF